MTATVYTTSEVDSLVLTEGTISLAAPASGTGPTVIHRQGNTTIVIATNSHGVSADPFQVSTDFNIGDVLEFCGDPNTNDGTFTVLDENGNYMTIDQHVPADAPYGI